MLVFVCSFIYAISQDGLLPAFYKRSIKNIDLTSNVCSGWHCYSLRQPSNLAELTNITALACLIMMSLGILRLRKMMGQPQKGEYKVPFVPVLPWLSVLACVLMSRLQQATWIVFLITIGARGLAIYFFTATNIVI